MPEHHDHALRGALIQANFQTRIEASSHLCENWRFLIIDKALPKFLKTIGSSGMRSLVKISTSVTHGLLNLDPMTINSLQGLVYLEKFTMDFGRIIALSHRFEPTLLRHPAFCYVRSDRPDLEDYPARIECGDVYGPLRQFRSGSDDVIESYTTADWNMADAAAGRWGPRGESA